MRDRLSFIIRMISRESKTFLRHFGLLLGKNSSNLVLISMVKTLDEMRISRIGDLAWTKPNRYFRFFVLIYFSCFLGSCTNKIGKRVILKRICLCNFMSNANETLSKVGLPPHDDFGTMFNNVSMMIDVKLWGGR